MNRKFLSLAVIVIIIVGIVAVAYYVQTSQVPTMSSTTMSSAQSTAQVPYNQTIVEDGTNGEPSGLDLAWSTDEPAWEITQGNLYQNLVFYPGNGTTSLTGVLASSWTVSPDAKDYVFHLKQGIVFSDGQPFNAYDVWFNLYRITLNNGPPGYLLGPAIFTNYAVTLNDLNTFNFTNPTPSELAVMEAPNQNIQVIDQYTIAFHFSSPLSSFIPRLACPAGGIEDPNFIQLHGGTQANGTANDYVEQHSAPGTGPYILQSWTRGQRIVLTLNPLYSGPKPHVGTVIYQFKSDIMDDLSDLKTGAAQMMYTVPFNLLPDIENTTGVTLETHGLSLDILYLGLDTQRPPLDNVLVRQAINWAIDRQSIINNIIHGYGTIFQGPLPRGMFAYNDSIQPYGYNLTMAQQLLTAAGYPGGKGIRPLSLIYITGDPVVAAVMQAVASDLSQIGITVNLQAVTQTTFFSIAATVPRVSNYPDILQLEWFPDYAYPDDYAYAFENVNSAFDNPNYNDTQLNTLTQAAISTGNATLQQQLYSRITERDKALAGYIWIYQDKIGDGVPAFSSTVQNVTWNPIQYGFKFAPLYIASAPSAAAAITQGSFWLLATIAPTKLTVTIKP